MLPSAAELHHFGPPLGTSAEWTHPANAMGSEQQRRTGAGSFVRSSAVQDDLPVTGNLLRIAGEVLNGKADRTGNGRPIVIQCSA